MRKLLFLVLFMVACAPASFAQTTDESRAEIFLGYSHMQAEGIGGVDTQEDSFDDEVFGERVGLNGFNAAITGFVTPRFGLTGDFSFNQRSDTTGTDADRSRLETRVINVLGGPTVRFTSESRVTPFVRALAGVANTRFEAENRVQLPTGTTTNQFDTNSTDFALALGGGVDVKLSDRIGLRLIQFDYNPVFLRDRSISVLGQTGALATQTLEGQRSDNLRFSFGITIK